MFLKIFNTKPSNKKYFYIEKCAKIYSNVKILKKYRG